VGFFANGLLIGSRASSPWTVTWSNASPGNSQLLAVAWNNSGAVTSAPVNVTVAAGSGISLAINGSQTYQVMNGLGVNVNSLSWKSGELRPALDMLADELR
jgi:hypothetical protein